MAARPEDGIEDRTGRGCIEAVLQWDAGDAGIPEVLRNDQGGNGDPRGEIPAEPRAIVGAEPADDGQPSPRILSASFFHVPSHESGQYAQIPMIAHVPVSPQGVAPLHLTLLTPW